MDEHESNGGPNTPKVEITRRTVTEIGTTPLPLTTLPRTALAAGPVDDREGASMRRRSIVVAGIAVAATAMLTIGVGLSRSVAAGPQAAPPNSYHRISAEHQRPDDRDDSTATRATMAGRAG